MKPITRLSCARAYGYLLDFCKRECLLDPAAKAEGHVTPRLIEAFLQELIERVGSVTRATYIGRIRRVTEILAPEKDFAWLRQIERDLHYEMRPRPKHHRIVASKRLLTAGLDLIHRGEGSENLTELRRARLVRDGLMIALLALCPIRLKNLAHLRLGEEILCIDGGCWIILDADETKSGRPDERPIPDVLHPYIVRWLERWRPLFLNPQDAFWPSTKGGALAYTYVGQLITRTILRELGVAVCPHLFRDCAVYTVATSAGDRMGIASSLLQHTDPRVTEKHYNKGASINATRRYHEIMARLEDDS